MGITTELLDVPVSQEVASEVVALQRAVDAVYDPEDPPVPSDVLLPFFEVEGPESVISTWLVRDGAPLVGYLRAQARTEGENEGFAEVEIEVAPDREGEGLERVLVAAALPWLRERGAQTLTWWPDDSAAQAAAESMGLTFRQLERCSRMVVAEVDLDQQDEWIAAPRAREAGYRVESWVGACPDELLAPYSVACSAMADAPLDDVDWTPFTATPELIRRHEAVVEARGQVLYTSLALGPDGDAAGMTAIRVHPLQPWFGSQEDTAVVREHRGHALGRWLKAANLAQVRAAMPDLRVVETYNAETNPWMLAINVEMGFRPYRAYHAHQADIDDLVVS